MKTKRKIIIIVTVLVVLLIGATIAGFVIYQMNQQKQFEKNQKIFAQEILVPDRIVYKQEEKYYEFLPGEGAYQQILNSIGQKIDTYEEEAINQEGIDQIHQEESFLELDYKKASKNYILTLNKDQNQFIKLLDNGGQILDKETEKVKDLQKILHDKIEGKKSYKLEYKEYMSENRVDSMAYKYLEQFKKINNNIYQVKIEANDQAQKVIDNVLQLSVPNGKGEMVPFSSFTKVEEQLGQDQINRYNMYQTAAITCNVAPGFSSGEGIQQMEELVSEQLGGEYGYEWTSVA